VIVFSASYDNADRLQRVTGGTPTVLATAPDLV
jgi:hypothetical protein